MNLTESFEKTLAAAERSVRLMYDEMSYGQKMTVLRAYSRHLNAMRTIGMENIEPAWLNEFIKDFGR